MPPRFVYWTIIFGGQPTAFRSATRDELLPTFKQIQSKHPDAQLRYFARGKLWYSDEEAHAALMRDRHDKMERERRRRPEGEHRGPWKPREEDRPPRGDNWKPRGDRPPQPGGWKPRGDRPPQPGGWKPRGDRPSQPGGSKPPADFRKPQGDHRQQEGGGWKPRDANRPPKPEGWKPKDGGTHRGRDWRPGGAHKDPRARFKVPRDVKRRGMAKKFGWKKKKDEE